LNLLHCSDAGDEISGGPEKR